MKTAPWDADTEAKAGRQLEQLRVKNFSSMETEFKAVFQNTPIKTPIYLPLAARVSTDGAAQYPSPPVVEYSGVSELQAVKMAQLREVLGVDRVLLEAEQQGVLQQAYILGCWLDRRGQMRLIRVLPFHVIRIEWDDAIDEQVGDLRQARYVELALPRGNGRVGQQSGALFERVILSRTHAWGETSEGKGRGLLHPSGRNPLGYVPLVGTQRERPESGWIPIVAWDVLVANIGLIVGVSDALNTTRHQIHARVLATGPGANAIPMTLPDGPQELWRFGDGDTKMQVLQLNPAIEKYIKILDTINALLSSFRNLRPTNSDASVITGAGLEMEQGGFLEERRRQEVRCEELEQHLAELVVEVHNATAGQALKLKRPKTRVLWRYVRSRQNVLQEAQSLALLTEKGLWSEVEEVSRSMGVRASEAIEIIRERLAWRSSELGRLTVPSGDTPGLEKIAVGAGRPSDAGTRV